MDKPRHYWSPLALATTEILTTFIPVATVATPGATAPRTAAITAGIRQVTIGPRSPIDISTVISTAGRTQKVRETISARARVRMQRRRHNSETWGTAKARGLTVTGIDAAIGIPPAWGLNLSWPATPMSP